MSESFLNGRVTLHSGNCLDVLATLEENSIDSVVTDPPYHLTSIVKRFGAENAAPALSAAQRRFSKTGGADRPPGTDQFGRLSKGFMGKVWDGGEIAFEPETWAAVMRVLKPGGYVVAFSGTRTYHRMACAIEDAGFEIRDQIEFDHDSEMEYSAFEGSLNDEQHRQFGKLFRERGTGRLSWKFGSGFPKSHNISRAISERCMCSVPLPVAIQAASLARPILQSEMCGAEQEADSCPENVRDLLDTVDAKNSGAGGSEQNVLSDLQCEKDFCEQNRRDQEVTNNVRSLRGNGERPAAVQAEASEASILQSLVSGESTCGPSAPVRGEHEGSRAEGQEIRAIQPGVEGRRDLPEAARQLREREIRPLPAGVSADGADGRLCDGASSGDGFVDWPTADADGVRASHRPSAVEQRQDEPGTMALQPQPQKRGAWDHCGRCGKPIVPAGLGTALKPACEPICLARKPLSESTVAANVLRWGTGALNIDGCRVATDENLNGGTYSGTAASETSEGWRMANAQRQFNQPTGRWPANVLHDGSDEVVRGFPQSDIGGGPQSAQQTPGSTWNIGGERSSVPGGATYGDSGSAARFFYSAKADSDDRLGSKHPTVKPVDLIEYLEVLVTPPGGTILDPFAGTGTAGEAAFRRGFKAILIEREEEYCNDIRRRMALCLSGQDERARESIKARTKDKPVDHGPLFGAAMTAPPVEQSPLSREPLQ